MTTTHVFQDGDTQAVRLPAGYEFATDEIMIRREGEAVILEPIKSTAWPEDFFESIRIDDPAFARTPQANMPPAPEIRIRQGRRSLHGQNFKTRSWIRKNSDCSYSTEFLEIQLQYSTNFETAHGKRVALLRSSCQWTAKAPLRPLPNRSAPRLRRRRAG